MGLFLLMVPHMPKARRNYSPDQDRDDNGEFGSGGGGSGDGGSSGGGGSPESQVKSEIQKAVPGAKSVSVTLNDDTETWHATVDGTKYKMEIGSDDDNMSFRKVGKGAGPKSISFPIPAFNAKHSCGCGGTCCGNEMKMWKSNLSTGDFKFKKKGNVSYLVVPVVMAKAGVVMNGSLTEAQELIPQGWNGRPVTLDHPTELGEFLSANATPETSGDWQIGTLYNTTLDDQGVLRSEAWIDVEKANELDPQLITRIKRGDQIDVSTGYFCDEEPTSGISNGREYSVIARNLIPDHLAILPNEEGACNWADGCGVRANKRRLRMKSKTDKVLGSILKTCGLTPKSKEAKKVADALAELVPNARGADDDSRQQVADLISNDASPFTPDDQDSLNAMSADTLAHLHEKYTKGDGADGDDETDPAANADGDEADDETTDKGKKPVDGNADDEGDADTSKKEKAMSKKEIDAVVNAAVKAAVGALITPEDRLAINTAKGITANKKAELIEKITKNSTMKKADVEKFDLATLETIANGLRISEPDFSGRAVPRVNEEDSEAVDMAPASLGDMVRNSRKGKEASH